MCLRSVDPVMILIILCKAVAILKEISKTSYALAGADPERGFGVIAPPKTYESNFFRHRFYSIRKTAFAI